MFVDGDISVIMPAYNEEQCLEKCFNKVVETMQAYGKPFEIILEEDGSTDDTPNIMDKLAKENDFVKVLHFPSRMGKGFGIRKSIDVAKGDYIVLIDADMEYPPEQIPSLLSKIDGAAMVIGTRDYRRFPEGVVIRAIASRLYVMIVKTLFGVSNLGDVQAGLKVFRRETLEKISPLRCNGFEIDTEILVKAKRRGLKIDTVPVTYTYKGNSKVDVKIDSLKMLFNLFKLRIKEPTSLITRLKRQRD